MAGLSLRGVTKRFGETRAVDGVRLEVDEGEFLALLGPSGCGKTTLLRLIAGFERVDEGEIAIDGTVVSASGTHLPAERRRVGIVFQSYALWPHMSVARNVGYPLEVARIRGADYARRVAGALDLVGLAAFAERRPAELSGGQRQRVALARCLVMEPALVLFDEPLANLDVHLRAAMEEEFIRFHRNTRATILYITHDQAEAMALADRTAVMDEGRLVQVDDPRTLYREPRTQMVASFIGDGSVVPCTVLGPAQGGDARVRVLGLEAVCRARDGVVPGPGHLCLRPEDLALTTDTSGIAARVRRVVYTGGQFHVDAVPEADVEVVIRLRVGEERAIREGETVRLAVAGGWLIPK